MRVLGVIPARGGSKGIPGKNVRLLGGKPLLVHTAEAALAAQRLSRVVLTTDEEEIAEVGRRCGLEVPFLRPAELALDDTPWPSWRDGATASTRSACSSPRAPSAGLGTSTAAWSSWRQVSTP
jgi:CMP-N-acetylneuraminic acid synthetase